VLGAGGKRLVLIRILFQTDENGKGVSFAARQLPMSN